MRHDGDRVAPASSLRELTEVDRRRVEVAKVDLLRDRALVYTDDGEDTAEHLVLAGLATHRVHVRRSTLEDVFLHLSGRSLVE